MPEISVVMGNYNDGLCIPIAIESLRWNAYNHGNMDDPKIAKFELIIVDDASDDDSVEIIKQMLRKHSDLDVKAFETNKNLTHNGTLPWNTAVKKAKYDLICLSSSDVIHLHGLNLLHLAEDVLTFDKVIVSPHLFSWKPRDHSTIFKPGGQLEGSMIKKQYLHRFPFNETIKGMTVWDTEWFIRSSKGGIRQMHCTKLAPALHMTTYKPLGIESYGPSRKIITKGSYTSDYAPEENEWGNHPSLTEIQP